MALRVLRSFNFLNKQQKQDGRIKYLIRSGLALNGFTYKH